MESTCKPKIVSSLLRESGKGKLDFSHPFQRKEGQWTRYMESLEVDSLLRGYSKSATTSSTGGLILALKRALLLLAPKGGVASTFTGPL